MGKRASEPSFNGAVLYQSAIQEVIHRYELPCHCEARSAEAISEASEIQEIASLSLAMTSFFPAYAYLMKRKLV